MTAVLSLRLPIISKIQLPKLVFPRCFSQHVDDVNQNNFSRVKLTVPSWCREYLLKESVSLTQFNETNNVKISFSMPEDYFPAMKRKETVVMFEGENKDVVDAVHATRNLLHDYMSANSNKPLSFNAKTMVNLVFPQALAKKLIGKKGSTLQSIKEQHKLDKLLVTEQNGLHNFRPGKSFTERSLVMLGKESEVKSAVDFVLNMLHEETEHKLSDNLCYKHFNDALETWARIKVLVPFYVIPTIKQTENSAAQSLIDLDIILRISEKDYGYTRAKVLLVEGPRDKVFSALHVISGAIRSTDIPALHFNTEKSKYLADESRNCLRLLLPDDVVSELFEKRTEFEDFCKTSGVTLSVIKKMKNDTVVYVKGEEENVLKAVTDLVSPLHYSTIKRSMLHE